jgi:hypothetical protein
MNKENSYKIKTKNIRRREERNPHKNGLKYYLKKKQESEI